MDEEKRVLQVPDMLPKPGRKIFIFIGAAVVLIIYFFCAVVTIPAGHVGVVFRKIGADPDVKGRFIVEKGEKGIQREVLVPGEYYLNPLAVEVDIIDAIIIPKGEVGIVTKRVGQMPPEGTILVEADDAFQGIQREPLQPGIHYINPFQKDVKIVPAVVAVRTAEIGLITPPVGMNALYKKE